MAVRFTLLALVFALVQGCAPSPPPELPAQTADVPPCEEPSFSLGPRAAFKPLARAVPEPAGPIATTDRAPEMCDAFAERRTASRCPATRRAALSIVDAALRKDIETRDADLATIDGCDALASGAVRALRAELAPRVCRDVLAEPAMRAATDPEIAALLRAQTIEARLERVTSRAPDVPFDELDRYVSLTLMPWLLETLSFVEELDRSAPSSGAGRAIVTLARGRALLRLAGLTRGATQRTPPCDRRTRGPAPFCSLEVKRARLSSPVLADLGDDLEKRGHRALRRGLGELADSGIIDDGRGHEAVARLATRRNNWDPPPLTDVIVATPPRETAGLTGRLGRALPVPLLPAFLAPDGLPDAAVMHAVAERGQPGNWARPPETLDSDQALSAGRARLAIALRYQRRSDVESALAYAQSVGFATLGPDDRAWTSTAVGLCAAMGGDAPEGGPLGPLAAVAASDGRAANLARFNLEVLAVAAKHRARRSFSPVSCRRAWDAVRKEGPTLEQRDWVDWCVRSSDAWAGPPRRELCRSP